MVRPLRVLMIEDSEDDAALLVRELRRGGYAPDWTRVDTADGLASALQDGEWDVITCDYVMPRFSAPAALRQIRAGGHDLPVIIVSGQVGEEVAVTAMKAGAHDYVSKHRLARLLPAIERELAEVDSRRASAEAQAAYRTIFELSLLGLAVIQGERIVLANPALARLSGRTPEALVGQSVHVLAEAMVHPEDRPRMLTAARAYLDGGEPGPGYDFRILRPDGSARRVLTTHTAFRYGGAPARLVAYMDVTDRAWAEATYREIFEQTLHGLVLVQGNRYAMVNPAFAEIFGASRDELSAISIEEVHERFIHPDDRAEIDRLTAQWLDRGEVGEPFDYRIVRSDGSARLLHCRATRVELQGRPAALIAVTDLTDRRHAEEAYRNVFEHSLQGLTVVSDGRIVLANQAIAELTGYPIEALVGVPTDVLMERLLHPDERAALTASLQDHQARAAIATERREFRLLRKDGAVRHVLAQSSPIAFAGAPAMLVAHVDITDRYEAEAAVQALNVELEARVAERTAQLAATARELESFAHTVSHDLRAPLRTIESFTRGVLATHAAQLPDEARGDLERVCRSARHLTELIDHLFDLSRIGGDGLRRAPVDLSTLAREIVEELAAAEPQRRVAVTVADGLRTDGDAALLRAALTNLLANAWKFTRPQPAAAIEVAAADGGGVFYVRDNGVGFDRSAVGQLFRPFQRLHAPSDFEGTGIGLATVARIIAHHGGRVWAEAAVGQGATFYFSIPASPPPRRA